MSLQVRTAYIRGGVSTRVPSQSEVQVTSPGQLIENLSSVLSWWCTKVSLHDNYHNSLDDEWCKCNPSFTNNTRNSSTSTPVYIV